MDKNIFAKPASPVGVGPAAYNWPMDARTAICEIIEAMPNFFGHTRKTTIGATGETDTITYTQA